VPVSNHPGEGRRESGDENEGGEGKDDDERGLGVLRGVVIGRRNDRGRKRGGGG
jgi:hypothetical protein